MLQSYRELEGSHVARVVGDGGAGTISVTYANGYTHAFATVEEVMKRKVKIELIRNTWMVLYADRRKYQKHSPAQFDATNICADYVREWVNRNPKLELVNE